MSLPDQKTYPPSSSRGNEHDPTIDKFSTLFMPSTPRASPTLPPLLPHIFRSQHQKEYSTTDFISVSANEDPLSLSATSSLGVSKSFKLDKDHDEPLTIPVLMPVPAPSVPAIVPTSSQPSYQPTRSDNASLTFFDKFAQSAKRNSEIRRKGLVDELLRCQANPLYFLHNETENPQEQNAQPQEDPPTTFDDPQQTTSDSELQTSPLSSSPPLATTMLHDLDHEYFSSKRPININTHDDNDKTPSERRPSPFPPPLPSLTSSVADSHISSEPEPNPLSRKTSTKSDTSPSRSLSSSFSTRWMSNLLKSSTGSVHHHQQGHGATPTLESILGVNADASSSSSSLHPPSGISSPTASSTAAEIYKRSLSSPQIYHHHHPNPHPIISHTLPLSFDRVIKHTASPFGSHSYIPPSGAPGFKGDSYDWDKGFSNELEREIVQGRSDIGNGNGHGNNHTVVTQQRDQPGSLTDTEMQAHVAVGIGAFMEKKSGNLDLKGRRAGTTPVLSQNLAILLRPHLPALSRLPRSWTLVYSLDQHGISLNTLYTRCEEALSPSRALYPTRVEGVGLGGVLFIIKDADAGDEQEDEGAFGAWIADGEGLGAGKKGGKGYFGGGESFLWKFTQGRLKVYRTSGKNNYVALCEPGYISFGGGDGHYGLYLDDTLYNGSSAPCPTFDNEPLCSPGPRKAGTSTVEFECVGLEVWGMGP